LAILLAVICTYPGIKVLSFKVLFLHIELKHVYLKEAVVRGYGSELFSCWPDGALVACAQAQQGSIQALSPALAVKFNSSPGRWQHFPLWPLFLQRDKGKLTEMTGTQHVGTLKHNFLHYITIKKCLLFFITKIIFLFFAPLLFGSDIYRQQASTFSALARVGIDRLYHQYAAPRRQREKEVISAVKLLNWKWISEFGLLCFTWFG
jgi:hypothetical protein